MARSRSTQSTTGCRELSPPSGEGDTVIRRESEICLILPFCALLPREAVAEGLSIPAGLYNALLYISSGGNNWEHYARGIAGPPPEPIFSQTPTSSASTAASPAAAAAAAGASGGGGVVLISQKKGYFDGRPSGRAAATLEAEAAMSGVEQPPPSPPPTKEELISATEAIWSHMQV